MNQYPIQVLDNAARLLKANERLMGLIETYAKLMEISVQEAAASVCLRSYEVTK